MTIKQHFDEKSLQQVLNEINRSLKERSALYSRPMYGIDQANKFSYKLNNKLIPIEILYNSLGYRGPREIDGSEDAIAIGCSQTFGYALPEEFSWPAQLSKISGLKIANLGVFGSSAEESVGRVFAYCNEFKKPKIIFALFPLFRMNFLNSSQKIITSHYTQFDNNITDQVFISTAMPKQDSVFPIMYRAPYKMDDILPIESAAYSSLNYIKLLIEYCKSNNIKLIWSNAEWLNNEILNSNISMNFYTMIEDPISISKMDCHKDAESRFGHPLYDWAADGDQYGGHNGIHTNIHYAESFHKAIW